MGRPADGSAEGSPAAKKAAGATAGAAGPNSELSAIFAELSGFEFKRQEKFKGIDYKKVSGVLAAHPEKITSGTEASVLPGVGKESAKKIDEFLSTGKIERLERYRSGNLED